jgi:hypothetical protein
MYIDYLQILHPQDIMNLSGSMTDYFITTLFAGFLKFTTQNVNRMLYSFYFHLY